MHDGDYIFDAFRTIFCLRRIAISSKVQARYSRYRFMLTSKIEKRNWKSEIIHVLFIEISRILLQNLFGSPMLGNSYTRGDGQHASTKDCMLCVSCTGYKSSANDILFSLLYQRLSFWSVKAVSKILALPNRFRYFYTTSSYCFEALKSRTIAGNQEAVPSRFKKG